MLCQTDNTNIVLMLHQEIAETEEINSMLFDIKMADTIISPLV